MDTVTYTDAGVQQVKRTDHLLNWKLVILVVVLLTSYIGSSDQSEIVTCCRGGNASFTWNYELRSPFIVIEWYVNDTQIAETSEPVFSQDVLYIKGDYAPRFRLHKIGDIGIHIINVTEADEGDYRCHVTLRNDGIPNKLKQKLQVFGITLGDYSITVTNTTEDCRTLKCGEPLRTNTTYEWSIKVEGKVEKLNRTTTNTFELCQNDFDYSVKCQRDHDCTETPWEFFRHEDTDSGNLDDSSPITTGIVVAVVFAVIAVIAVIAISAVVIWRKLKSRAGRRSVKVEMPASIERFELVDKTHQPEEKSHDELEELKDSKHLQDKETCEQVNLNPTN